METLAKYAKAANAIRTVSVTANRTSIASLREPLLTLVHQRRLAGGWLAGAWLSVASETAIVVPDLLRSISLKMSVR
jgi:hypothetical protein